MNSLATVHAEALYVMWWKRHPDVSLGMLRWCEDVALETWCAERLHKPEPPSQAQIWSEATWRAGSPVWCVDLITWPEWVW